MSPNRRTLLQGLISLPFFGIAPSGNCRTSAGAVNIVGFGHFGKQLVRQFAAEQVSPDRHYCALVDYEVLPDRVGPTTIETIGPLSAPVKGPLVVVAGLGRHGGGVLSREWTRAFQAEHDTQDIRGVLVLPFAWEWKNRQRAMEQLMRFEAEFGRADIIDNQALLDDMQETLQQFFSRVNPMIAERVRRAANA